MADDTPGDHRITSDRDTIREWADEHELLPVLRTGADERDVDFVQRSSAGEHEPMEWDEFHTEMEESDHVVVHDQTADESPLSVRGREETIEMSDMAAEDVGQSLVEGDVVTGEITETKVVETTVVERAELESELVDTELVDEQVVDVELESRECTNCDFVPTEGAAATDWFDPDHYLESRTDEGAMTGPGVDVTMAPYQAELDVEDRYRVTRDITERFTVETRIADTDVTEMDTLASDDIDVDGLHQSIVESDLFRTEEGRTESISEEGLETEFVEGDRVHTYVERHLTVEDDVVDRKHLRTEISDVSDHEVEIVESTGAGATTTSEMETGAMTTHGMEMDETTSGVETEGTTAGRETEGTTTGEPETGTTASDHRTEEEYRVSLTDRDEGKDVVDASGEEVGMVVEVDEAEEMAHVDPHPGLTERIKAKLDMGEADGDAYRLWEEQISRITDDRVELQESPDMDEEMT